MAVPDAGCGGRAVASHSSPRCWLLLGDSVVLMAVPDTGCGGRHLFSWQFPGTLCGVGRRGFFWQCHTLVLMGRGGGSHGSPSRWLWGGGRGVGSHCSHRRWLWMVGAGFSW